MEIIFIGTGCGIPNLRRAPCSTLIRIGEKNLLIDTGMGILRKLKEAAFTYKDIDYLIYTHFHLDHIADFAPFIFATKYQLDLRKKDLIIIGPKGMNEFYQKTVSMYGEQIMNLSYNIKIFEENYSNEYFSLQGFKTKHTSESTGYIIKTENKKIVYPSDTEYFDDLINIAKDADLLIIECAFPFKTPGHLYPEVINKIIKKTMPSTVALTHLYPICDEYNILHEIQKNVPSSIKIIIPEDLTKITI